MFQEGPLTLLGSVKHSFSNMNTPESTSCTPVQSLLHAVCLANTHWTPACLLPMRPHKVSLNETTQSFPSQRTLNASNTATPYSSSSHSCLSLSMHLSWTFIPEATAWLSMATLDKAPDSKKLGQSQLKSPLDKLGTLRSPLRL